MEPGDCGSACDEAAERIRNLEAALQHCRTIGTGIGILMERHRITTDDAFNLLVLASSLGNRKLHEISAELVLTGRLPEAPPETPAPEGELF